MAVLNDLDRFHLVGDVIDRVPSLRSRQAYVKQLIRDKLIEHKEYICQYGQDMPEVSEWRWTLAQKKDLRPRNAKRKRKSGEALGDRVRRPPRRRRS
jgi:hypothetical protein